MQTNVMFLIDIDWAAFQREGIIYTGNRFNI